MSNFKEELDKRYTTTCPYCDETIYPTRSMGMLTFGMTEGHGTCPKCKNMTQLKYDREADTLTACRDEISDKINAKRKEVEK